MTASDSRISISANASASISCAVCGRTGLGTLVDGSEVLVEASAGSDKLSLCSSESDAGSMRARSDTLGAVVVASFGGVGGRTHDRFLNTGSPFLPRGGEFEGDRER